MDTTFVLSLLGALSWIPTIFNLLYIWLKKPKLRGRILSIEEQVGMYNGIEQNLHFYEINIISLNESINILDLKIELKYYGQDEIIDGHWSWINYFTISKFGRTYLLDIPTNQTIPYNGTISNLEMQNLYLVFTTECNPDIEKNGLEELRLTFYDANRKKRKIKLNLSKIKANQVMWDDAVWKEVS